MLQDSKMVAGLPAPIGRPGCCQPKVPTVLVLRLAVGGSGALGVWSEVLVPIRVLPC